MRRSTGHLFQLGGRTALPLFIHCQGTFRDIADFHEMFANAAAFGAALHICHINSSSSSLNLPLMLEMLEGLMQRGVDVTTEAYGYTASMIRLDSGVFAPGPPPTLSQPALSQPCSTLAMIITVDCARSQSMLRGHGLAYMVPAGWEHHRKVGPEAIEWLETGERLTYETFEVRRQQGGLVALHAIPKATVDCPAVMIASDVVPYTPDGKGHPRSAGTFCRVLGLYVRQRGLLTLPGAIRKMTLAPAQRLQAQCAAFRRKGRLQVGMDADIVVFDPATVTDNATFQEPMQASSGVEWLFVCGRPLIAAGELQDGVAAGMPYRADRPLRSTRKGAHPVS